MLRLPRTLSKPVVVVSTLVALAVAAVLLDGLAASLVAKRIRAIARGRGSEAAWRRLDVGLAGTVAIEGLTIAARADTVVRAEIVEAALRPLSLLLLRPRLARLEIRHARITLPARRGADPDSLVPDLAGERGNRDAMRRRRGERLRAMAGNAARVLLLPARRMPRLVLRDVVVRAPSGAAAGDDSLGVGAPALTIARLDIEPRRDGIRLFAQGVGAIAAPVPFDLAVAYGHDNRITGGARFDIPDPARGAPAPLRLTVEGHVSQDRRAGVVSLAEDTRITIGELPLSLSGSVARAGPRVRFALASDSITAARIHRSIPRPLLGPLAGLDVHGAFDYRLGFDLDIAAPDSVSFTADVIPHRLSLDPAGTRLDLFGLDQPFTATIRLPRGRIEVRDLSPANPNFRTLDRIDSTIAHALVTNEDGGFFRHRGFNVEAVKASIAENLKAGAYRRGAGTITMQIARNLYLGHDRTLSRKGQEVVLAWVLEHLTGVSKRRLLEIYLNIIEWGPGVHGANEAARYYFAKDAGAVTVAEALFLATIVPSPRKWKYRFDTAGDLRPFARAQMHFIGRAMIAKGWLAAGALPPADSLQVALNGGARAVLFPASPTPDPPLPEAAPEAPR